MKILLYTPTVGRGGVHRVVKTLYDALVRGFPEDSFTVLGQEYDEIGKKVSYPCSVIPIDGKLPLHPDQFPYLIQNGDKYYARLSKIAPEYDLVYCPSPWWGFKFQKWTIDRPFVTTISDFAFDVIDMGGLAQQFRGVVKRIDMHASAFVVHSKYWQTHAEKTYRLKNVHVIEHTMDFTTDSYDPSYEHGMRVRAKYGLPDSYVLAFHCYGHKDPATILRAILHARQRSNKVPPLVIAGIGTEAYIDGYPMVPGSEGHVLEIRRVIKEIGATLGSDLHILGEIPEEDIAGLFAFAKCAVSASLSEGDLPGTAFEAIAAHIPFICSDFPVFTEKLGDHYAWIFEKGNASQCGERMIEACDTMRQAALDKANRAYGKIVGRTAADVAKQYMTVFRKAVK